MHRCVRPLVPIQPLPNHPLHPGTRRRTAGLGVLLVGIWLGAPLWAGEPALEPFAVDWSRAGLSAVDLSRFVERPAGQRGFLRVRGPHIVTPGGDRFRFWGVNLCGPDCFPTHDEAEQLAADLARFGINIVRFHHLDSSWGRSIFDAERDDTRQLSAENLERLDYFIAALKHWGIYANLNLNVLRRYKAGDAVRDWKSLGIGKAATYFNPRLLELQHEYARQLLTHRNPYTGQEYRHEPAVAVVEMINENSLLEAWVDGRLVGRDDPAPDTWSPIPRSYAEELTDLYNAWLEQQVPIAELDALRNEARVGPRGRLPRLQPSEFAGASRARFHAEARFYRELERGYLDGMKRLLRDTLGVRSILVGTADHNDSYSGFAHIESNLALDLVDGHGYWQHPNLGQETWIQNTPMVNDPLDSTVAQFARTPVAGRPFTISEVNHPFPHQFAAEGFVTLTAYALLHDWDGIYWFTWGLGRRADPQHGIQRQGWFDFSNDPVKLANLAAAGLLWHRHDIAPARSTVHRSYTPEQVIETLRADRQKARPFFLPGYPIGAALQHATRFSIEDRPGRPTDWPPAPDLSRIESDTGQLVWQGADRGRGLVSLDTDRAQALIGFLGGSEQRTRHLQSAIDNPFAVLVLTALDDQPIARSRRLLMVATARATNTGFQWKADGKTVAEWGAGPVRIEPVTGTVTLTGLTRVRALRVRPLEANGVALAVDLPAVTTAAGWNIRLGQPATTWCLIEVER